MKWQLLWEHYLWYPFGFVQIWIWISWVLIILLLHWHSWIPSTKHTHLHLNRLFVGCICSWWISKKKPLKWLRTKQKFYGSNVRMLKKNKNISFFPLLILFHLLPLLSSPSPPCPARCSLSHLHLVLPSQRNLPAGPEAAGHLLAAAPVPEGDQRRQRPHRREQPALLLQHRQLDPTLPHFQPKGPDPQQPEPQAVLWVSG